MTNEELLDFWAQADYEQGLVKFVAENGFWDRSETETTEMGELISIRYIWDLGAGVDMDFTVVY